MIDGALVFILGMLAGAPFWIALAWHRFCRTERPALAITVTPEVTSMISQQMVMAWLDERGLVWMPRGVDFKPKAKQ